MKEIWKLGYLCTNAKGKNQFVEREMKAASYSQAQAERQILEKQISEGLYPDESNHEKFGFGVQYIDES